MASEEITISDLTPVSSVNDNDNLLIEDSTQTKRVTAHTLSEYIKEDISFDDLLDEEDAIVPVNKGGTGASTVEAARDTLGLGNTSGALPVANGGTGASSALGARSNLGLGSVATESIVPVSKGGTGKSSITSDTVLVGNGTNTPTERTIDTTSGGTANSNALITSGAVKSKVTEIETYITDLDSDIKRYKLKSKTKVVYPDYNGRISVLLSFNFDDGISRIPLFVLANNSYDHNGSYFFSPIYWCKENINNVPGKLAATLYNSAGNNPTIVPSTSVLATLYYVSEI